MQSQEVKIHQGITSSGQVTGREIERLSRFNGSDDASGEVMADSDGEVDDGEPESALRRIP